MQPSARFHGDGDLPNARAHACTSTHTHALCHNVQAPQAPPPPPPTTHGNSTASSATSRLSLTPKSRHTAFRHTCGASTARRTAGAVAHNAHNSATLSSSLCTEHVSAGTNSAEHDASDANNITPTQHTGVSGAVQQARRGRRRRREQTPLGHTIGTLLFRSHDGQQNPINAANQTCVIVIQ